MDEKFKRSFNALNEIKKIDLSIEDNFEMIMKLVNDELIIPYIQLTIPQRSYLFRARINDKCPFTFKTELSYNPNIETIGLGRANYQNQSVFYASHDYETAVFETSQVLRKNIPNTHETITVGRWYVKKSIKIAAFLNDVEFLNKGGNVQKEYFNFLNKNPDLSKPEIKTHMDYISNEFAKVITDKNQYKISAALFNAHMQRQVDIFGIAYPSVEWKKNDLNFAIIPESVDDSLILDMVIECDISLNLDDKISHTCQTGLGDLRAFKIEKTN